MNVGEATDEHLTNPRYLWMATNAGLWEPFRLEHRLAQAIASEGRGGAQAPAPGLQELPRRRPSESRRGGRRRPADAADADARTDAADADARTDAVDADAGAAQGEQQAPVDPLEHRLVLPRRRPHQLPAVLAHGARALELGGGGLRRKKNLFKERWRKKEQKKVSKVFYPRTPLVDLDLEKNAKKKKN